jgi:uncharacterized cupredoxin-like copper-binding protein
VLAAGSAVDLEVDLTEPGDYALLCPIDGHRGKGMEGTLTVGA